jgi:hypothetical protein
MFKRIGTTSRSSLSSSIEPSAVRRWLACFLLALGLASPALTPAEAAGKLPNNVIPALYHTEFHPDLDRATIAGSEAIDIEFRETTDRIELNAVAMTINRAGARWRGRPNRCGDARCRRADRGARLPTADRPRPVSPRHRFHCADQHVP